MAWHKAVPNGTAPSKQTAVIPYYPLKEKGCVTSFFLCAAVRMAAECRARILWQMVIIRI